MRRKMILSEGQMVGEWTLLSYIPATHQDGRRTSKAKWICRCRCSTEKPVDNDRLVAGNTRTCGHQQAKPVDLAIHIRDLVKLYGGLNVMARALRIDAGYLSRLQSGEKHEPGDEVLEKLGLKRTVSYVRTDPDMPLRRADAPKAVNSVFALGAL